MNIILDQIPKCSGIYCFTNKVNNKKYIGSALNLKKRFTQHLSNLFHKKHHSIKFQNDWNKYGITNFEYEILEFCKKEVCLEREQYYLNLILKADDYINNISNYFLEFGYNMNPKSLNRYKSTQSEQAIFKSIINNPLRREILQFDFNGNLIKEYLSISQASKELKISKSLISNCCNKISKYSHNYIFIYKDEYENNKFYLNSLKTNPFIPQVWNKNKKIKKETNNSKFIVFNQFGQYVNEFKNTDEICKFLNVIPQNFYKHKNKKLFKHYWIFDIDFNYSDIIKSIKDNYLFLEQIDKKYNNQIYMYDVYGSFISSFNSVKEISNISKLSENSIYCVLSRKTKQLKGFVFKYYKDIV